MSSIHVARQGFVTKSALPSVSRVRGTTQVADNRTVLLLNGNGTNGAQNNTFVADNFGTGGQGNYSVFFDGSGDSLTIADNNAFDMGTGDFTVECWVYHPTSSGTMIYLEHSSGGIGLYRNGAKLSFAQADVANLATSTNDIPANQWVHVAASRSGTTLRLFINGVQEASVTNSTNFTSTSTVKVGNSTGGFFLNGYLSNLRVVKGTAVYTTGFTPPTSNLTAISGTSLLTCQGTVIRDASSNNFAITVNGDAKVATNTSSGPIAITRNGNATQGSFSPFTLPDGQWSNFFAGSSDELQVPQSTSLDMGSSDFTVEAWVYITGSVTASIQNIFNKRTSNGTFFGLSYSGGNYYTWMWIDGTSIVPTNNGTIVPKNQWVHLAYVRSGNTFSTYINGVLNQNVTNSITASTQSGVCKIGNDTGYSQPFGGNISNLRVVIGSAVYTSNFTPPTAPLTAITNTRLLTCQSNRFRDNSSNNFAITRNGDVRVTPWSPFAPTSAYSPSVNGGSGYFDGTTDWLSTPATSATQMGSSSFTTEFWYYPNSLAANQCAYIQQDANVTSNANLSYGFYILTTGALQVALAQGTSRFDFNTSTGVIRVGTWHHIALVRDGNVFTLYVNGVSVGTTTQSITLNSNAFNYIGTYINTGASENLSVNGYISNLRIVKGTAVYTSAFTPPTAPVTNITNTSLLLNFTNAGIFDTAGDQMIETMGNVQLTTAVKRFGSASIYFDGVDDYLKLIPTRELTFSGDFTFECWIRLDGSQQSDAGIFTMGSGSTDRITFSFDGTANTLAAWSWSTKIAASSVNLNDNNWHHIAVTRSAGTLRVFADGVVGATSGTLSTAFATAANIVIGTDTFNVSAREFKGWMDDIRITLGQARYTANFTPPSSELIVYGTSENIVTNSTYGVYQLA